MLYFSYSYSSKTNTVPNAWKSSTSWSSRRSLSMYTWNGQRSKTIISNDLLNCSKRKFSFISGLLLHSLLLLSVVKINISLAYSTCTLVKRASFIHSVHQLTNTASNRKMVPVSHCSFHWASFEVPQWRTFHWAKSLFPFLEHQRSIQVHCTPFWPLQLLSFILA